MSTQKIRNGILLAGAGLGLALYATSVSALYVYPSRGQSAARMQQDKYACRNWAISQTGFDPMRAPSVYADAAPPGPPPGGIFRGAAGGALLGTIGGAIGGDAGKGAAIGAGVGAMIGVFRRARWRNEQAYYQQQRVNQYNAGFDRYMSAYKTCLRGRGYTVS